VVSEVPIGNSSDIGFFVTVDNETPVPFSAGLPSDLVIEQGTVEAWIVENRALDAYTLYMRDVDILVDDAEELVS
jgi:hypothetical protein